MLGAESRQVASSTHARTRAPGGGGARGEGAVVGALPLITHGLIYIQISKYTDPLVQQPGMDPLQMYLRLQQYAQAYIFRV